MRLEAENQSVQTFCLQPLTLYLYLPLTIRLTIYSTFKQTLVTICGCFRLDMFKKFIEDYSLIENPNIKEVYQ